MAVGNGATAIEMEEDIKDEDDEDVSNEATSSEAESSAEDSDDDSEACHAWLSEHQPCNIGVLMPIVETATTASGGIISQQDTQPFPQVLCIDRNLAASIPGSSSCSSAPSQ